MRVFFFRLRWLRPAVILFLAPLSVHALSFDDDQWIPLGGGLPGADNTVRAVVMDDSGHVYIGGSFSVVGDSAANRVAYWNGSTWTNLGDGIDNYVQALALDSAGNLYAGGSFSTAGGVSANNIAMWDGSSWTNLGEGVNDNVDALVIDGLDNVYIGGSFTTAGVVAVNHVAKWNGTTWTNLGSGLGIDDSPEALALDSANNLYVGGSIENAGSITSVMNVAMWNGSSWTNVGAGVDSGVEALAVDSSDNLYAGGYFNTAGSVPANYVAIWDGSSWTNLGDGVNGPVFSLDMTESGTLLVGGDFDQAGDDGDAKYIAQWDGSIWSNFYDSVDASVLAIAGSDTYGIYAGGYFYGTYDGEVPMTRMAFWDGDNWNALGEALFDYQVRAVAVDKNSGYVYYGGDFTRIGDLAANRVARWDGSSWTNLGVGVNDSVHALMVNDNGDLVVGGEFSQAGGSSDNRYLARWNGASWTNYGLVNYFVFDLAPHESNSFYASGRFTSVGGVSAQRVAYWNGSNWTNLGAGLVGGAGAAVYAVAPDTLGNVYAGGTFNGSGVSWIPNLARWTGTGWTNVWPWPDSPGTIRALKVDSSNRLYVAGSISGFNNDVQRYDGISLDSLTPGVGSSPFGLAIDGSDNVYAVGTFSSAGVSQYANQIAMWNGTAWTNLGSGLGPDDSSGTFAIDVDGAGNPYVGGSFLRAGNNVSAFAAYALVHDAANLIVTKNHLPEPVIAGASIVYTITVSNAGPSEATGVALNDTLPSSFAATGPTNFSLGGMSVGAATSVTVSANVASSALGIYTNVASVSANEADPFPMSDSSYDATTVITLADLGIAKADSADPAVAGALLTYSVTVTNSGPSDALNVEVVDTMPGGVTPGGAVTNTIGTLAVGASTTVQFNVTVDPGLLGTITNAAAVTSSTTDNNSTNDTAVEATVIVGEADLGITKSDDTDPVFAGTGFGYTVTVTNSGPSDAHNVKVIDTMPAGVTPGGTITNIIGTLAAGASTTVQFNVTTSPGLLGVITNAVSVTSTTMDSHTGNDDAEETTQMIAGADLGITKTDDVDPVVAGTGLGYTITVTNSGPSHAYDVVIIDTMPTGTSPGGTTTNTVGTLAVGSSTTIQFSVTVNADTLGAITNAAAVTTSAIDLNASNDSVEETTQVNAEADLSLRKMGIPSLVIDNNIVTYTLTVSNAGPSVAGNVLVVDTLPAGVTPSGIVNSNLGAVAVGAVASFQLVVSVNNTTFGMITNTASVSTDAADGNAGNDIAEAVTTVQDLDEDGLPDFADPDRDGDGLPDWWETLYYGGPTNATSSALAANGKNTIWEMWVADINPTNPASMFPPLGVAPASPGTMGLEIFPTSTARVYDVLSNTNLNMNPQSWIPHSGIMTGAPGGLVFPVTNDVPARNYRSRVRLP